jgi:hypothetical protein
MTMMKNLLPVVLANLLLAFQGAYVYAEETCFSSMLTFNFKPKFPHSISVDYVCTDDDTAKIQTILGAKTETVLQDFGYTSVKAGDLKTGVSCPSYPCDSNPGDKCLSYCLLVDFCGQNTVAFPDNQLEQLGQDQIDALRADLPACLGLKDRFMLDVHAGGVSI